MGRSFKYHRPRGRLSLGSDEPNALVTLDAGKGRVTPNLRATQIELYEGLKARSQNAWPSLQCDAMAVNGLLSALFPGGLLLQDLHRPPGAWERSTSRRSVAQRGSASRRRSLIPTITPSNTAIATSRSSAPGRRASRRRWLRRGRRARHPVRRAGGIRRLAARRDHARVIDGAERGRMARRGVAELAASPRVTLLPRTQVFGYYPQNFLAAAAAADRPSRAPDPRLPARAALAGAGEARRARDRRARAAAGVPRQRSAGRSCSPSPRGRSRRATASGRAQRSSSRPRTTAPIAPRSISSRRASRSP